MQYSEYSRVKALGEGAYGKAYLVKDVRDGYMNLNYFKVHFGFKNKLTSI